MMIGRSAFRIFAQSRQALINRTIRISNNRSSSTSGSRRPWMSSGVIALVASVSVASSLKTSHAEHEKTAAKVTEAAAVITALDLDATSFEACALHPKKTTLVLFHAPWCGHCKRLYAVYDELAQAFAGNESVQITRVDCTAVENEALVQAFGVKGFPTLLLFDGQTMKVHSYRNARDLASMHAFVSRISSAHQDL